MSHGWRLESGYPTAVPRPRECPLNFFTAAAETCNTGGKATMPQNEFVFLATTGPTGGDLQLFPNPLAAFG